MLAYMAATTQTRRATRAKSVGAFLKARRAYLGLTAAEFVERTNGVITLKLLSQLENDHRHPSSLRVTKYRALLAALELTPQEFERETGVPPLTSDPTDDLPGSVPFTGSLRVPIAGTVSAGLLAVQMETDFADFLNLDPHLPGLRGRDDSRLVAVKANGDSMVSERASFSVPHGSTLVVEIGAIPTDRDLVVAWLDEHDTAVVKEYREGKDAVLRSYNPRGPVFRLSDQPFDVRGVVRMVITTPGA